MSQHGAVPHSHMCWQTVTNHTLASEELLCYSLNTDPHELCETWVGTSVCCLFDVNLWVQEETLYLYEIFAILVKLALQKRGGWHLGCVNLSLFTQPLHKNILFCFFTFFGSIRGKVCQSVQHWIATKVDIIIMNFHRTASMALDA